MHVRYMCLIYEGSDPRADVSQEEREEAIAAYDVFTQDVVARGLMEGGDPLQPPDTATTVRVQDGDVITTDGPYAETKEWLAGYYVIKAADLDEAIEVASKIPSAKHGAIEVRPVMELPSDYSS